MWKIVGRSSAAVFVATVVAGMGIAYAHDSVINWALILTLATLAAVITAVRTWRTLKTEFSRVQSRNKAFLEALQELVDTMARASFADLSVFVTAHQQSTEPTNQIIFATSRGSYNHGILVQMTDLGIAKTHNLKSVTPDFAVAQYELTSNGRTFLGKLLATVADRRRYFAGSAS